MDRDLCGGPRRPSPLITDEGLSPADPSAMRCRWQQISAWQNTTPPTYGTEVVTVGDFSELPGKVRTIGKVSDTGAVEY